MCSEQGQYKMPFHLGWMADLLNKSKSIWLDSNETDSTAIKLRYRIMITSQVHADSS